MSAALFDLALRVRAREVGVPVPRLLHTSVPTRSARVAVWARQRGKGCRVWAVGADGAVHSGSGSDGLAALARAAGCVSGDLGEGATALIDRPGTLRVLDALAVEHADPTRCRDVAVAAGSSLAGWWVERSAHPGSGAVVDLLAVTRQQMMLGTVPGSDDADAWRAALGVPHGIAGLHAWWRAVSVLPTLPGLEPTGEGDDWLLGVHQDALSKRASWNVPESLYVAAMRLQSRCDAADIHAAALLDDPLWRLRGVHTGHVCHGDVVVGAHDDQGRVVVRSQRLDTRLKAGVAVVGWPGDPLHQKPEPADRFAGEVVSTAVTEHCELEVTIGGLRRTGYKPGAGEILTVVAAPPNPSTIRSHKRVKARLYKRRFSWLSQGVRPVPTRRDVPLAVLIAAAEPDTEGQQ
ncbi:hypothetical protein A5658_04360 [Mycobacterium sp. 1245111.1]|uniref:hypothetical protein n=1 Tax=Mycobacterium sp. 1245111.1 TaxID=1834073 RepID=UPI0007FBD41B|nr:hypothetical protein [Mycobacterium sp. 1245111.1]OBK37195.1 hypothetical protein A5658_04360 [Mycobacterium sp. 1245111.1]